LIPVSDQRARRPLYLDCDTGIDDSMALAYLLNSPQVELVAVGTVSGNTSARQAAQNTLALLRLAGREDVPVFVGAHDPLGGTFGGGVPHIHGHNGIGDIVVEPSRRAADARSAAEALVELAHQYPGELEIVTIGPLTNVALALELDPELPHLVKSVTTMGGAALVPGNVTTFAEANIWNDPEAANRTLNASWDVTLVPLDVTLANTLDERDQKRMLQSTSPLTVAVGRMLDLYFDFYVPFYGRRGCALHDPLAAAIAVGDVRLGESRRSTVTVDESSGPGRGRTVCHFESSQAIGSDPDRGRVRVVLAMDAPFAPSLLARLQAA
jgi:purine nucleosidase